MGHMEGEAGTPQTGMPQQELEAAQVDPSFEQMSGEAMALMPSSALAP